MARALPGRLLATAARLWPDGGQGQARRNAWAAMVNDHINARARADAERAMTAACAVAGGVAGDPSRVVTARAQAARP